jgi:hypothetical protein
MAPVFDFALSGGEGTALCASIYQYKSKRRKTWILT